MNKKTARVIAASLVGVNPVSPAGLHCTARFTRGGRCFTAGGSSGGDLGVCPFTGTAIKAVHAIAVDGRPFAVARYTGLDAGYVSRNGVSARFGPGRDMGQTLLWLMPAAPGSRRAVRAALALP